MLSSDPIVLEIVSEIDKRITASVKQLLETRHLYQSVVVKYADILEDLPDTGTGIEQRVQDAVLSAVDGHWATIDRADHRPLLYEGPACIRFETPDLKLFCSTCKRIEAFNSISSEDFAGRGHSRIPDGTPTGVVQVFALSFQCQSCKGAPEVFLVRRHKLKLTQSGRAPMEHIEVPAAIPKSLGKWFRGAIVAHQSGQTLAGVFLLRTLIEQWAKQVTGKSDLQADKALNAYLDLLPSDFKDRFPSLRSQYSNLSDDIHGAIGSTDLFDSAKLLIIEHFEARKLLKL